jgi:hypothetical protein
VLSENITFFRLSKQQDLEKILMEMELKIKKVCKNVEIAYHDFSGNRWVFLVLNGNPTESKLRRMESTYKKLYRRMSSPTQ